MNPSLHHSITPLPSSLSTYFYAAQIAWIQDDSPLKFCVKSRQTGFTFANGFRLVFLVSAQDAHLDAYIVSRDQRSADLALQDCLHWADLLHCGVNYLGEILFDRDSGCSAFTLQFANGRRIYSLSSNPNALAGKRGHVTLDEFALHPDQRLLYRVAKPVTMWGGQFSIISTPRGTTSLFNQIYRAIKQSQSTLVTPTTCPLGSPLLGESGTGQGKFESSSSSFSSSSSGSPSLGERGTREGELGALPQSGVQLAPASESKIQTEGQFGDHIQAEVVAPDATRNTQHVLSAPSSIIHPPSSSDSFGSSWSLHEVPIQRAVAEGIVERINQKKGTNESRDAFLARLRAECIDQEQWDQEYCCIPADESAAFFSYELLDAATDPHLRLMTIDQLLRHVESSSSSSSSSASSSSSSSFSSSSHSALRIPHSALFLGLDVARHRDLCVLDVGEKIGNLTYDRLRLELHDQPYSQIEAQLYPLLALPQLKRACIDKSGIGDQLSERARERFGWKVEPVHFTGPMKEQLAFALRHEFEDRLLRIPPDDKLRADLRALKKELTPSGKLTFIGETDDSHCDRTWAKALRQHAARRRPSAGAILI